MTNSYRFIQGITRRMLRTWVEIEQPRPIPWTPLQKPLRACNVALISSAGIAPKTDQPFDQEGERRNPWWGDPSYRVLPNTAGADDVTLYHLHIDPRPARNRFDLSFPAGPVERTGIIGGNRHPGRTALLYHGLYLTTGNFNS